MRICVGLIRVKSVAPDSPAMKMNTIRSGDVCLKIAGLSMQGKIYMYNVCVCVCACVCLYVCVCVLDPAMFALRLEALACRARACLNSPAHCTKATHSQK